MASIEEGLRDKLVAAGLGTFEALTGWSIHIGREPASPDSAIIIARTGGTPPDPKWLLDFPTFQIRVRGAKGNYKTAEIQARKVKDLLLGIASETITGDIWVSITMQSDVGFMGYDANERPNFTANFRMIIEPATPTPTNREPI